MIKAIFIDWGYTFVGVKESQNRDKKIDKLLKPLELTWQEFLPYWRQFYVLRSAGKIKSDKQLEIIASRVLQKEIPIRKIIGIITEAQCVPKEHIEVVKKLKKDYKVAILSNSVKEWVDRVIKKYKIEKLFDTVVISSEVGARKPDALIYFEALKKLSVKARESIFVADEVGEDLVPATGLGMKTIWLHREIKRWWWESDKKVLKIYKPNAIIKDFKELTLAIKKLKD